MNKPPSILIAVLSTFERNGWHHPSISELMFSLRFNNDYATGFCPVHNFQPAAAGRNVICKFFLKDTDADWICMIDNDMHVPVNVLDSIKDVPNDAGVVAPMFYLWDESKPVVKMCLGIERENVEIVTQNGKDYINFAKCPPFVEIYKCGTGVIFIHRKTLEKLPYPWFKYLYDEDQAMVGTEDIQFTDAAKKAGIKMYGNTRITVGHYHNVNLKILADLVYQDFKPIDKPKDKSVDSTQTKERPSKVAASA